MSTTAPTPPSNEAADLKVIIDAAIARLRQISEDPFALKVGEHVEIEISPASHDERVTIARQGWGDTCVHYTSEGLILDVFAQGDMDPVHTTAIPAEDLEAHSEDPANQPGAGHENPGA